MVVPQGVTKIRESITILKWLKITNNAWKYPPACQQRLSQQIKKNFELM